MADVVNDFLMRAYGALMRAAPTYSGLTRLSFNPVADAIVGREPRQATAKIDGRVPIQVDMNDYHGRILYFFGTNDKKVSGAVNALLREGDSFLDIGANYSSIGIAASRRVGPTGRVHLFEPQQSLIAVVRDAIAPLSNVTLHPVGLLDEDCTLELARPAHHSGMATVARDDVVKDTWVREEIRLKNASTYLPPLVKDAPFGVKLDVEGVETRILPALLAMPGFQFAVFEGCNNQDELFAIIERGGAALYGLDRVIHALRAVRVDALDGMAQFHDFILLPNKAADRPAKASGASALSKLRLR